MRTTEIKADRKSKKRNDRILLVSVMVLALAAAFLLWGRGKGQGMTAVVTVDGEELGRYSLLQENQIAIGDTNVLIIKEGAADMISAQCPDQVCVKHSPISKTGESIICLPNKVVVTIEGITGEVTSGVNGEDLQEDEIDIMVK